jgi:hypothetical protein
MQGVFVFATPAQQPGCAPGLQAALFAHLARLGARLREAKNAASAWLPGNTARVRFPGARRRAAHAGRFRRLPHVGGVAGAGSRGKVKLPRAREGEVRRNISRLYMAMAHPLSPLLPARCCSTPLVRDRRRLVASRGSVHLFRSSPFPALEIHRRAGAPPGAGTPRCWASSSTPTDLLPLLANLPPLLPDLLPLLPDLLRLR